MSFTYTTVDDAQLTASQINDRLLGIMDAALGIKKVVDMEMPRWADSDVTAVFKVALLCADNIHSEAENLLLAEKKGE